MPREPGATNPVPGLYGKFTVMRTDGRSEFGQKHERCDYFVLDWIHDPFTLVAVHAYADACEATYPELARDLRARIERALTGHRGSTREPTGPAGAGEKG